MTSSKRQKALKEEERRQKQANKRGSQGIHSRAVNVRPLRTRLLIVCEGAQTEPNYFKSFPVNTRVCELKIAGEGMNTDTLVTEALATAKREGPFDEIWAVFDRDSFPAQRFNEALNKARRAEINVAYTNEAFELWYLLHFDYLDMGHDRDMYQELLEERLKHPYQKNSSAMYWTLKDQQESAIRNAKRLLEEYGDEHNPERDNPCTTVHLLVERLNRLLR